MTAPEQPGSASTALRPDAPSVTVISAAELQRAASHGSLWTMVHTVVAVPIAFAANAVVARSLGPDDYGRLAVITLVMAVAVAVTNFGVIDGVVQWGAAAHARGDADGVDEMLRSSLGFHLLVQLPLLVVTALVLGLRGPDQPPVVLAGLLLVAVLPTVLGGSNLCISIENRTAAASRLAMGVNLVTQVVIAVVAVLSRSAVAVWSTRSLVPALAQPINFWLLTPHRRRVARQARVPRGMPAGFWRFCLLTMLGGVLAILVTSRSEIVVLQAMSSPATVGVYALAFGIAAQMRGPVEALLGPLMPGVAGILEVHPHLASAALLRALRVCSLLSAMLLLTVPLLSALLPVVYGHSFASAAAYLPALALVAMSQTFVNPLFAFARAQKLGGWLLWANLAALGVDLAVAVALTPVLGAWGAVAATSAAQAASIAFLARFQVRRGLMTWREFIDAAVSLGLAAVVVLTLSAVPVQGTGAPVVAVLNWALGVLAWVWAVRSLLSEASRGDLARVPAALPGPCVRPVAWVLRLIGVHDVTFRKDDV